MADEQQAQGTGDQQAQTAGETPDFEAWLAEQDEGIRTAYAAHTGKLKGALQEERETRKQLAKQLADVSKKAEAGSATQEELARLSGQFETVNRKATFYESAPGDVRNLRLAWLAATDANLVDKDGDVDWAKLRANAPELFGKAPPPPHAGNGAGQTGQGAQDMNLIIRRSAGRGV
jgi:hypothetical protein